MKQMRNHLIGSLVLLLMFLPCRATSKSYYVSADGDDNNPGTEASPKRSIQSAISLLGVGDTLWIRGGSYHEEVIISNLSGLPGQEIMISAYPGEKVVLD